MALFYLISHQWHHSYTVYFGLYVGLPPVAQADLDRLRGQTSRTAKPYLHIQRILPYSSEDRTCPTCSVCSQCTVELLAVPGSAQSACNEGRIYTSVAHAQYD